MLKPILCLSLAVLLAGCGATSPPPFEKDKTAQEREYYQGATGLVQQQKDQNYLMNKELSEKCEQARLDLAVAASEGQKENITHFKSVIKQSCK
jgi:starvation-inducible outer membrane lipoprotein